MALGGEMPALRRGKIALSVALLAGVFVLVLLNFDPKAIELVFSGDVFLSVVFVVIFLIGGVMLASLRLKLITSDLGYRLSFRDAAVTLSVGQIAGSFFFQFAGQLIGRGAVLSRKGISPAATVVISGYERVIALGTSLLLAGAGALYLFGTLSINMQTGGLSFVKLTLGLAVAFIAGAVLAWGRALVNVVRNLSAELLFGLLRSFLISLAIQVTTLAAYVALERALAPHIGIVSLAAASCIVMLAASLPVSFGGWGLRELSAVVALQAIGLSAASALLTALLIGFLSLAVIAGTAVFIMLGRDAPSVAQPAQQPVRAAPAPDYTAALDWSLPLIAATAVFFQIYIPTGGGPISVNLADPVVMIAAVLFGLRYFKAWPDWPIAHASAYVAAATAVIFASVLHGWMSFGWTDWAFVNKGLGWLILLCYGATGALIILRGRVGGFELLLRTFVATGVSIACIEIVANLLSRLGVGALQGFADARISGFSQNPNSFAFVLMLVMSAIIVLRLRPALQVSLLSIAMFALWLAGSRAGLVAAPLVIGMAAVFGAPLRPLLTAVAVTMTAITLTAGLGLATSGSAVLVANDARSTREHLDTVWQGLSMFLAYPIVGAGLGAYMEEQIRTTGVPLVIHSTPIWLLAETGLVGFAVFMAAAYRLFVSALPRSDEPAALLLLLILGCLAVMSSVHELMYQRAFWILLGAVVAMPANSFWQVDEGRRLGP
jgi:O-antigen ligase